MDQFVTDIAIQSGLAPMQLLKCAAHSVRRDRELRCARTVRAQGARDMDRDGRRRAHRVRRSLALAVGMAQPRGICAVSALAASASQLDLRKRWYLSGILG